MIKTPRFIRGILFMKGRKIMGMLGNYIAVGEDELKRLRSGERDILDINPKDYPTLDIDKSWQAVHYLLCGDIADGEPPMGYVVPLRDDNFLESEMEFGAFFADAGQVREAVKYLDSLDEDKLNGMFDFSAMLADEVYPIMDESDEDGFFEYLCDYVEKIRNFYMKIAERGDAVVFYVS